MAFVVLVVLYRPTSLLVNISLVQWQRYVMTTPVAFLRETYTELTKVTWPTRQEVVRLTVVVILVSLIVGVFIGGLDLIFTSILQTIVK